MLNLFAAIRPSLWKPIDRPLERSTNRFRPFQNSACLSESGLADSHGRVKIMQVGYDYRYPPSMAMRDGNEVMIGWFEPKRPEQGNSEWVRSTKLNRFALYDL